MIKKTIKLKVGKVFQGSVFLVGEVLSVDQKLADQWIAAGQAEESTEISSSAPPTQTSGTKAKRVPKEKPDDAG